VIQARCRPHCGESLKCHAVSAVELQVYTLQDSKVASGSQGTSLNLSRCSASIQLECGLSAMWLAPSGVVDLNMYQVGEGSLLAHTTCVCIVWPLLTMVVQAS
jgi:hypothetical protein